MIGLHVLGHRHPVVGADAFTPSQVAGSPEMTPAELADLDRRLSPAEQERVDAFQAGEADVIQKKEELTSYVDPKTGEKRVATVEYIPGVSVQKQAVPSAYSAPIWQKQAVPSAYSAPIWKKSLFAALAAAIAIGVGLSLMRSR